MPQAKRAPKGKRPSKAVSVLGIAGVSFAASTGGWPAEMPSASFAAPIAGSVADNSGRIRRPFRCPVSITRKSPTSAWRPSISSTKKTSVAPGQAYNLLLSEAAAADTAAEAAAAEVAAAFEAAEEAAEAAALAFAAAALAAAAAAEAAAWASAGAAAAACLGEVAPSGARLERLAITLTDARLHARV